MTLGVYHENDKWHVDMPPPAAVGKSDPDAVYYDHPASGNVVNRTKTNVSIFDEPVARPSTPKVRAMEIQYRTYLVGPNGPLWETTRTYTATGDAAAMQEGRVTDIKARDTKKFAAPLDGEKWDVGRRVDAATNRPGDKTEQARNPFHRP